MVIKVVALKGCNNCKTLIRELYHRDIDFKIIDADTNNAFCDSLEESLGISNYPIVILQDKSYIEYYYLANTIGELKGKRLSPAAIAVGCLSLEELIYKIVKHK